MNLRQSRKELVFISCLYGTSLWSRQGLPSHRSGAELCPDGFQPLAGTGGVEHKRASSCSSSESSLTEHQPSAHSSSQLKHLPVCQHV